MAVTVYRATDGSAPTLSGTAGDLINLLDKCLVAGYGSKSAAGWTKPYTSTNIAVFRQGAGQQRYYRVDDAAPGAGGAKEARVVGYESMTGHSTGTNPFPTVALAANGLFIRKSVTADATTRDWCVVADDRTAYVWIFTGDTANVAFAFMLGDIDSRVSGDLYAASLIARATENSVSQASNVDGMNNFNASGFGGFVGHSTCRPISGTVGSVNSSKEAHQAAYFSLPMPNNADNALYASPIWVQENASGNALRGMMRGLYCCHHGNATYRPYTYDVYAGVGDWAGLNLMFLPVQGVAYNFFLVDTTGPW